MDHASSAPAVNYLSTEGRLSYAALDTFDYVGIHYSHSRHSLYGSPQLRSRDDFFEGSISVGQPNLKSETDGAQYTALPDSGPG